MADQPTRDQLVDARLIVAGAIAAAGKMDSSIAWRGRVNSLIGEVGAMFGERSVQMRRALAMLDAAVFSAEYLGYDTDYKTADGNKDTSTRWQVKLRHPVDREHPDGIQRIRTERTDQQTGRRLTERLKDVEVGSTLLCWKVHEDLSTGGGRTVSVLYHFETLPPRGGGGEGRAPERPAADVGAPVPSTTDGDITDDAMNRFGELTKGWETRTVVAFVTHLRERKLFPPDAHNIDEIAQQVKEWPL